MARISRNCLNVTYYHVMVQGINKEFIFNEKSFKEKYCKLIFEKSKINNVVIISYCIMDNHIHILVKSPNNNQLSKMMSQINSSYGKFYNRNKNRVGYVFRDRYRLEPIFNQAHLKNCIKYIHENPRKAGMILKCGDYKYSSYNDYINGKIDNNIIEEIFGRDCNFIEKISGDYEDYNFIETSNEFGKQEMEDFNKVCQDYRDLDFTVEENIYRVSKELKKRCGALNTQIIDFMGLKRTRYYNIIKKQGKLDF